MVERMARPETASLAASLASVALVASAWPVSAVHAQDPRPALSTPSNQRPAQPSAPPPSSSQAPQLVDPSSADRNSLSGSLRVMPVDLSPHGFDRVYAVPGRDDLLMRSNGALYAVFSQSSYARDPRRGNAVVTVPASTIFYIGRPNFATIRSTGVRDVSLVREQDAPAGSTAAPLASVHGVRRIDAAPIDGRADRPGATRVDDAGDGRFRAVHEDGPAPGSEPAASAHGPAAPVAAAPAPEPDTRATRPGFADRIDELMRRARKAP